MHQSKKEMFLVKVQEIETKIQELKTWVEGHLVKLAIPENPRTATEESIKKLAESISGNPKFFEARPILLSNRTGELVIIGGEQRSKAAALLVRVKFYKDGCPDAAFIPKIEQE